VPACGAPAPARSNPRNTGESRLTAAYNRLSAAFYWAETADPD